MLILSRLLRDPNTEGGGGAAATAAPAPAAAPTPSSNPSQAYTGPTSYGGSSAQQLWEDPYDDPKFKAQTQPQPPGSDAGNKTPGATPVLGEGGSQGQPAQGGNTPAPSTSPTAATPGQAPAEAKGALSPDDKAYWSKKDPAYADLPDHPAVAKMSESARALETAYTKSQQYLGVVNQTIEDYKAILQSGDPAEIAKMVEHFGGEVHFDTRKPEDVVKELEGNYSSVLQALQAVQHELPQEAIPVLNKVLAALHGQMSSKVGEIQSNQKLKAQVQALAKQAGIAPSVGNPYERYKTPAQANITALERESADPHFWDYYNMLSPEFKPGGMFHAQGITAGKAFGASRESARYYMELAKGRWLSANMEKVVLPQYEQSWLAKQKGNGAAGAPPKGAQPAVNAAGAQDPSISAMERRMEDHMKRHS